MRASQQQEGSRYVDKIVRVLTSLIIASVAKCRQHDVDDVTVEEKAQNISWCELFDFIFECSGTETLRKSSARSCLGRDTRTATTLSLFQHAPDMPLVWYRSFCPNANLVS